MYRFATFLMFVLLLVLSHSSCGNIEAPVRNLIINGEHFLIQKAVVDYLDDDINLDYKRIALKFTSLLNNRETFLTCIVYLPRSKSQENHKYNYAFIPEAGKLSHVLIGKSVVYDERGEVLAGKIISESGADISGGIKINHPDGTMDFNFDLEIKTEKGSYLIAGNFCDELTRGYVFY